MSEMQHRPTRSIINLDDLAFNFRSVRDFVGGELTYLAVVKANAYGHGAIECARRLSSEGVDWFGVALPEEGVELRRGGIRQPILVLGGSWPGQEKVVIDHGLVAAVFTIQQATLLDRAAQDAGIIAPYHVKIDTGMGRVGVRYDQAAEFVAAISDFTNIKLDGLMTHFAAADDLGQSDFTELQIDRFERVKKIFAETGFSPTYLDLANSPGAIAHPRSRGNMVRLGGVLYGLADDVLPKEITKPHLRPVLSLTSQIALIKKLPAGESLGYGRTFVTDRDSLIATVPVGYADGYPRALSNIGEVIVNGKPAPVVGRVSMDWLIVDVTEHPNSRIGDEVVVIGRSGTFEVRAEDLAAMCGTISYEITCGIKERVPRSFVGSLNSKGSEFE